METIVDERGAWRNANGKPCGGFRQGRRWYYFCGMEQVGDMCRHAQSLPEIVIDEYNKRFGVKA